MSSEKTLPQATHHWWPRSIQQTFWCDQDGYVHRKKSNGEIDKKKPKRGKKTLDRFGAIPRGHNIDGLGPWSHCFEQDFDLVDEGARELFERIRAICLSKCKIPLFTLNDPSRENRFEELCISESDQEALFRTSASIVIRSPGFRRKLSDYGTRFGLEADLEIGKANIPAYRSAFSKAAWPLNGRVEFVFVRSLARDFVMGDWFYENVTDVAPTWRYENGKEVFVLNGELSLPLTPDILLRVYHSSASERFHFA